MRQLKLSLATKSGEFHTLAGVGIMVDLLHQAVEQVGADPSEVVLRFKDGSKGAEIDVMYPTPHTFLFSGVKIEDGHIVFNLGRTVWLSINNEQKKLPLADPNLPKMLGDMIKTRAKGHRKTKSALDSD